MGREAITIDGITLRHRFEIGPYGYSREFDFQEVRHLRVSPSGYNPWSGGYQYWGYGGGIIAFDYTFKTYRFGVRLDEAEAQHIIKAIQRRYPIPEA
jgi:hypothetical protein